jgi:hypothetical protein
MMISPPATQSLLIQAEDCCMFATRLRCVSIAPLATPVVPPVYCRKATSSGRMSTSGSAFASPSSSAWRKRTACGRWNSGIAFFTWRSTKFITAPFGKDSRSPMQVVTTCFTACRR